MTDIAQLKEEIVTANRILAHHEVVFTLVYMELNAAMLMQALGMGEVTYLSDGEINTIRQARSGFTFERG